MATDVYSKIQAGYYKNNLPYSTCKANKEMYNAYREEEARVDALFKYEALQEMGLLKHPKKDKIYAKAWADGHSSGYSEVLGCLRDLAELFDDELNFS